MFKKKSITALNSVVAKLFGLFARVKPAHWSVLGMTFIGLHKLLDESVVTTINQQQPSKLFLSCYTPLH